MQQRQPRLGDILDDYCPRERRLTNHAVVAMVGDEVKQTRCTTCDAEHEFKNGKVPRQRKKTDSPAALYAQVAAGAPKRIAHEPEPAPPAASMEADDEVEPAVQMTDGEPHDPVAHADGDDEDRERDEEDREPNEDGPVHRPLIRASLPRTEGQPPATRPIPEFTIRQPTGRPNRFRPRNQNQQRGGGIGSSFQGNQTGGNGSGGFSRQGGGRPPFGSQGAPGGAPRRDGRRQQQGAGRKRFK